MNHDDILKKIKEYHAGKVADSGHSSKKYTSTDVSFTDETRKKFSPLWHAVCFASMNCEYKKARADKKGRWAVYFPCIMAKKEESVYFLDKIVRLLWADVIDDFSPEKIIETGEVWCDAEKHSYFKVFSAFVAVRYLAEHPQVVKKFFDEKMTTWEDFVELHQPKHWNGDTYGGRAGNNNHHLIGWGMPKSKIPKEFWSLKNPRTKILLKDWEDFGGPGLHANFST